MNLFFPKKSKSSSRKKNPNRTAVLIFSFNLLYYDVSDLVSNNKSNGTKQALYKHFEHYKQQFFHCTDIEKNNQLAQLPVTYLMKMKKKM
jgi:hypothetical protein